MLPAREGRQHIHDVAGRQGRRPVPHCHLIEQETAAGKDPGQRGSTCRRFRAFNGEDRLEQVLNGCAGGQVEAFFF